MPSPAHNLAVLELRDALVSQLAGRDCHVRTETDAEVSDFDLPQPDVTVAAGRPRDYPDRYPGPKDLWLVAEVCNTSQHRDRVQKLGLYAAAGLAPYVIVDLVSRTVEVRSEPEAEGGEYAAVEAAGPGESVTVRVGDAEVRLAVDELIPPV